MIAIKIRGFILAGGVAILLLLQGCASLTTYHPLPENLENQVQMPGFPNVRAWGDVYSKVLENSATLSLQQEKAANHGKLTPEMIGLALSGGGGDGAFGAGLICGWTASGKRPNFKFVTGISTGALMVPFVFLGPAYDEKLKASYTTISDKDIYKSHGAFALLLAIMNIRPLPSLADDKPLSELIASEIDAQMLKDIAAEQLKGRRLLVGTTQFNAQRLVIWDMGAIAAQGTPQALDLFRKVLIASASLPASFPPQYFTVNAGGQQYQEMHVDGGMEAQVMLFENALLPFSHKNILRKRKLYIIRNEKVTPVWSMVQPKLQNMAVHAIDSLVKSQGIGDLYRLYVYAKRDEMDYNVAYIPTDFTMKSKTEFDNAYMRALFVRGYAMGRDNSAWHKYPPDFDPA